VVTSRPPIHELSVSRPRTNAFSAAELMSARLMPTVAQRSRAWVLVLGREQTQYSLSPFLA
jgi:hypothetical protein